MKITIIALCGLLASSYAAEVSAESNVVPKTLKAFAWGGWNGLHHVELQGDTLLYWREPAKDKEPERIKPPVERWDEFRRELDAIGIWRWRSEYATRAIFDATSWTFEIKYSDRSIKTGGDSGIFPDETGAPTSDPSAHEREQYTRYVKALQKLLGRDTFPQ